MAPATLTRKQPSPAQKYVASKTNAKKKKKNPPANNFRCRGGFTPPSCICLFPSSRPERPDFSLRAGLWRVGPRSGGTVAILQTQSQSNALPRIVLPSASSLRDLRVSGLSFLPLPRIHPNPIVKYLSKEIRILLSVH